MALSPLVAAPRAVTRAEVLRTLFKHISLPRYQIAEYLQLTGASISRIVTECLEAGLIVELPSTFQENSTPPPSRAGRRPVPLALNPEYYAIAGIHIGLLWLDIGLFNLQGTLVAHHRVRRPPIVPAKLLDIIASQISSMVSKSGRELLTIGISMNGQVDSIEGVFSANNVLGWPAVSMQPIAMALNRRVIAETDTYAMAVAEFMRTDTKPHQPLLLVNVGTSIGMGIVVNRSVVRGRNGLAGFIEHLPWRETDVHCTQCNQDTCLTNTLSDRALLHHSINPKRYMTIHELLEASHTVTELRSIVDKRAQNLGQFLAMLAIQYDPGRLVLAGSCLADDGHQLNLVLHSYAEILGPGRILDYSPIETPEVYKGELLPLVGAGTVALNRVFSPDLDLQRAPSNSPYSQTACLPI